MLNNYGLSKTAAELPQLMTELELNETVLRRYPHEVSGGECQRAAILRALCVKPQLLICDEITESLDLPLRASVTHLLDRLCCSRTVACIFITHDIRTALRFAPRVLVLKEGKIDFSGSAREFFILSHSIHKRIAHVAHLESLPQHTCFTSQCGV